MEDGDVEIGVCDSALRCIVEDMMKDDGRLTDIAEQMKERQCDLYTVTSAR